MITAAVLKKHQGQGSCAQLDSTAILLKGERDTRALEVVLAARISPALMQSFILRLRIQEPVEDEAPRPPA